MSPFASPKHMIASGELRDQLKRQVPADHRVVQEVEIDLQLGQPWEPGTVRRADLAVVAKNALDRVEHEGGLVCADDLLLVIEVVSPGSQRMDRIVKRGEYADAGIGHYWILDIDEPVSLLPMHLAGDLGYAEDGEVTGVCTVGGPFQASLRLDELAE
jgi:Uma2 family endonuclease